MSSILGFSTEAPSGDFTPILKYDAKAGRFFRVDRVDSGQGFESVPVDITDKFKALADFENVEVGPINFSTGGAPSFLMVRRGEMLPAKPDGNYKNGVRFMLKLAKDCGGEKPIREIAGTSRAFLSGVEAVIKQYLTDKDSFPGKLPVIAMDGLPQPVKSGSGAKSSTNYHPKFRIIGWAPRGDLVYVPKTLKSMLQQTSVNGAAGNGREQPEKASGISGDNWDAAPATGSQRAEAPKANTSTVAADDFG